jgi:hypothetical protein
MNSTASSESGHFHAVRFYDSPVSLCRIVADFLSEGFRAGQPALVIATPEHRAGIEAALRAQNVEVGARQACGELVLLDAEQTLAAFMVDGMPDPARFHAAATAVIQGACGGRTDRTVRAYGEMVDVLWKREQSVAAIRLEMLWNKLAATQDFSLLCGYAMGNFYKGSQHHEICAQHTLVIAADGRIGHPPATL